jgi:chromosome condensin MukBEF MukE localization factor
MMIQRLALRRFEVFGFFLFTTDAARFSLATVVLRFGADFEAFVDPTSFDRSRCFLALRARFSGDLSFPEIVL